MDMAPKKSKPFDASEYLDSDEAVADYITEALLSYDLEAVTNAIGVAAKARGMTRIAEETGLSRESLYKALSGDGHPQFETIALVLQALGLRLRVEPDPKRRAAEPTHAI
jgi:probable addiction module antidote protein